MKAWIVFRSLDTMTREPRVFSPGCYTVSYADGRELPFDWDEVHATADFDVEGRCVISAALSEFSVDFNDNYANLGLDISDITPQFLTKRKLTGVNYNCYGNSHQHVPLELVSFEIEHCAFSAGQIKEYNDSLETPVNW